jgi:NAD(P)-dependent dehydrogenase (short-subunit alcohol dehydrogenase family)
MRLKNKIAIVTGGAHGIGRAIVERFAEEGAVVFIADLDKAAGEETVFRVSDSGGRANFIECDVSLPERAKQAVATASKASGTIDILCNNAAYLATEWHASGETLVDEWEQSFRVSLMGTQYFTREVLPLMTRSKAGSIINVSSVQGLVAGRNSAAYTTMKHALIGFTHSVACDYGPHNIRCNAICPGAITTRISPPPGSELHQRQVSKTFLGRVGEPGEVATAALFLASEESSYVTGAVLPVDGGWTAM